MIFDAISRDRFYTRADCHHVMTELMPPDSTFGIWLGTYTGSDFMGFTDGKMLRGNARHQLRWRPSKGHVQTMAFGRVVLQILSVERSPNQLHDLRTIVDAVRGTWDGGALVQVWPLADSDLDWPPRLSFDDGDCPLQAFSNRFNTSMVQ